jgi:hypothetical protein
LQGFELQKSDLPRPSQTNSSCMACSRSSGSIPPQASRGAGLGWPPGHLPRILNGESPAAVAAELASLANSAFDGGRTNRPRNGTPATGSEALLELSDNIDIIDWSRRTFDFAVLGGIQVDQFGNLNTVAVEDWAAPKVRGPGAVGASVLAGHAAEFFIVMNEHTVRTFRPQVDFVSALGFGRTGRERAQLRLPGRGLQLLISPLGVFDFTPDEHRMRLRSVHAWSSPRSGPGPASTWPWRTAYPSPPGRTRGR